MSQGYLKKGKNCQMRTVEKCAFLKSMAQEKYSIFIKVTGGFLCIFGQFGVTFGKNSPRGISSLCQKPTSLNFVVLYKEKKSASIYLTVKNNNPLKNFTPTSKILPAHAWSKIQN